jgi:hypothetical protein
MTRKQSRLKQVSFKIINRLIYMTNPSASANASTTPAAPCSKAKETTPCGTLSSPIGEGKAKEVIEKEMTTDDEVAASATSADEGQDDLDEDELEDDGGVASKRYEVCAKVGD